MAGSLILYAMYKKLGHYPMQGVTVFMGLSVVGFLFLFISSYAPALAYPACVLIGFGFVPCQFMPLYGLTMMKSYPSRFIAPGIIGMALLTVLVQSALVEAFRAAPNMLHLAYVAITVVCIVIYLHLAPLLLRAFRQEPAVREVAPDSDAQEVPLATLPAPLDQLTARELEVLRLIGGGYSNRDIAELLVISQHTVNDYTKKIYRKLDVHSRHAAAQIINRLDI